MEPTTAIPLLIPIAEALGISLISLILLIGTRLLLLRLISRESDKTMKTGKRVFKELLESTTLPFLIIFSLFIGSLWIDIGDDIDLYTRKTAFIAFLILLGLWANVAINHTSDIIYQRYKQRTGLSSSIFSLIKTLSKLALVGTLAIFILDNLNFQVSTLVAGLGIGGIAIALAVQNILQDLFASLSIIIDKPFLIGDFINVDGYMGTVENVGIKTTRIRSLSGEQIIFSNGDLLKTRLRNYKKMKERRIVFTVQAVYETPLEKVKKIPKMLQDIIEKEENLRFGRAHFKELSAYSLDFEVVYFVLSPDYDVYMDAQQNINEKIIEEFNKESIEFAYPTSKSIRIEPS